MFGDGARGFRAFSRHVARQLQLRSNLPDRLVHACVGQVQLGGDLLVDLIRFETHTCYHGLREQLHEWGYGCGECPACELRKAGYEKYVASGGPIS